MTTENLATHLPPQGSAPVYRRLWRGYGPLMVVALLLILMALLVPTRSTEAPVDDAPASSSTADSGTEGAS